MNSCNLVVHCKKEQFDVYIGRPSEWGNPFKGTSRKENIAKFESYARKKFSKAELLKIKGKKLGCWCSPLSCHGDILIKLIKEIS